MSILRAAIRPFLATVLAIAAQITVSLAGIDTQSNQPMWLEGIPAAGGTIPGSNPATHANEPALRVAANKIYKLSNPFPFPVDIKIYGDGAGFPKIVRVPASPAPPIAVPYPGKKMKIRIRTIGGSWSKKFTIKWKKNKIKLPAF